MTVKKWLIIILLLAIAPLGIISCGGSGSATDNAPGVTVSAAEGGTTTVTAGTIPDSSGKTDTTLMTIILTPGDSGLPVNGEKIPITQYTSGNTVVTDEHGNTITPVIDSDGNIKITPVDGTVAGTYVVVITNNGRVYEVTVVVSETNTATITTSISYPSGYGIIADLTSGALTISSTDSLTISVQNSGSWAIDPAIHSITTTDSAGKTITVSIDPVTGDIISAGTLSGPFTTVIVTDSRVITIVTDENGKILSITENGQKIIADLSDGTASSGSISLDITDKTGGKYSLESDVTIISATAGSGAISIPAANITVDKATGDLYISGSSSTLPAGPYEIKVSVNGNTYVIKTDASGNITGIIPGNVMLQLTNGKIMFNGEAKLAFDTGSAGSWTISSSISSLNAVDANGKTVAISVNSSTGNIVTSSSFTDPVTITFNYTDSAGNVITYTLTVVNGSVTAYSAEITNPSSNFDFSTVTNIKVSLNVVSSTTGLPIGQASISLNSNGSDLWQGFTDDSGISIFAATVDTASKTTSITVTKAGYTSATCAISGIGKLIEFGKRIAMTPTSAVTAVDTDGDGVADADDQYPNDPTLAKKITDSYTLAFEDNYKYNASTFDTGNDADFNDVVVKLTITEMIDSQNKVRKVQVTAKALASLSSAKSAFGIYLPGKGKTVLFTNAKSTTATTGVTQLFEYENGISRSDLGSMPYDPFLIPSNDSTLGEVHLASVSTTYTGVRTGSGTIKTASGNVSISNFVWALMIPDGWKWPKEGVCIGIAYPKFLEWCNSAGTLSKDWYNYPAAGTVVE